MEKRVSYFSCVAFLILSFLFERACYTQISPRIFWLPARILFTRSPPAPRIFLAPRPPKKIITCLFAMFCCVLLFFAIFCYFCYFFAIFWCYTQISPRRLPKSTRSPPQMSPTVWSNAWHFGPLDIYGLIGKYTKKYKKIRKDNKTQQNIIKIRVTIFFGGLGGQKRRGAGGQKKAGATKNAGG